MLQNKGFVMLDTLIGIYIIMAAVSLVLMMSLSRNRFQYDFGEQELYDIWNDPEKSSIYAHIEIPQIPIVTEDTPLSN